MQNRPIQILVNTQAITRSLYYLTNLMGYYLPGLSFIKRYKMGRLVERKHFTPDQTAIDGYEMGVDLAGVFEKNDLFNSARLKGSFLLHSPIKTIHAVYSSARARTWQDTQVDTCDASAQTLQLIKAHIHLAATILKPPRFLIMHPGRSHGQPKKALKQLIDNISRVLPDLEKNQVYLLLENNLARGTEPVSVCEDPLELMKVIDKISHPLVQIVLDTSHAINYARYHLESLGYSHSQMFSFQPVIDYIAELGKRICYVHINATYANDMSLKTSKTGPAVSGWDFHAPLTIWTPEVQMHYAKVISALMKYTSIPNYQYWLLELVPKKVVGIMVNPYGLDKPQELLESVQLLRGWIQAPL